MAEDKDADNAADAPPATPPTRASDAATAEPPPEPDADPTPPPVPEPAPRASGFRLLGVAVLSSLLTGLATLGGSALYFTLGEQDRASAAEAAFQAELQAANARTEQVRAELRRVHQRQALYVAHTSVIRAMQELDRSNFGSADELLQHAGEALGAADPAVASEIRTAIAQTAIEVGEDRIAQLNALRELAKQLQASMER